MLFFVGTGDGFFAQYCRSRPAVMGVYCLTGMAQYGVVCERRTGGKEEEEATAMYPGCRKPYCYEDDDEDDDGEKGE